MPPETPDTSEFPAQPAQPGQAAGPVAHPAQSRPAPRNRSGLAMGLLALLVVAAVGLGIWLYSAFLAPGEDPVIAAPETSTTEAEPTTGEERTTVTSTASTSSGTSGEPTSATPTETSTGESTETGAPTTETTEPAEAPTPMALPAGAEQCAANVNWRIYRATDVTSCGFAEAVAVAMNTHADRHTVHDVQATSPVTGQGYTMRCSPEQGNSYVCRGGDNAVVVLEERAARD